LQLEHHSTVELVNRLVGRKLLLRERSVIDKRQVHLRLTVRGKTALKKISAVHSHALKSTGKELIRVLQALQ
jgi:DNA-binding MarR family transcriptional regulator